MWRTHQCGKTIRRKHYVGNHYLGNITELNRGSLHKGFYKSSLQEFNSNFNTMLDTYIRDVPNFIRTFIILFLV